MKPTPEYREAERYYEGRRTGLGLTRFGFSPLPMTAGSPATG